MEVFNFERVHQQEKETQKIAKNEIFSSLFQTLWQKVRKSPKSLKNRQTDRQVSVQNCIKSKIAPFSPQLSIIKHSVWKSQKMSHKTLRAKRATFTFIKNAKNGQFWRFLIIWSFWSNSVTRQVNFNRPKIGGKCQNLKIQMRQFEWSKVH